jgi:hypothetical protein
LQYRVQFLDRLDNVVREVRADDRSGGFPLLMAWPPNVIRVRVIYPSGLVSTSKALERRAA